MDSVQTMAAPVVAEFDSLLHEQLLDRRMRLREAQSYVGPQEDFSRLLGEVDAALLKFENGSYGVCVGCQDTVEPERLIQDPLMTVCLGCLTHKQRAFLESDLQLAADIQRGLLPRSGIACEKWHVDYAYEPAGIVSGDYVDIIERGDEFYFILGDVSGKGMAASLLMSNLHAIFHSLAPMDLPLAELMTRANRLLTESSLANQFATLVAGRANRSGEIEISNAGHLPPILIKNGVKGELNHAGLPLGLFCDSEFTVNQVRLDLGDSLLLFSDGVTETNNPDGEEFGVQRLFDTINGHSVGRSPNLVARCLAQIERFRDSAERHDDLTMLVLSFT
ncbi:MAG TPA: SpoIIE family protein phosphatase [Pyrinomonadaceae bacterium]|nr:SpoIIE family protein phosphatase [Pyrinomonadaceae bacterium]